MKRIFSFSEFTNESVTVEETIDESVDLRSMIAEASKDDNTKNALISRIKKIAPSLADDENFMKTLMKSFPGGQEEETEK